MGAYANSVISNINNNFEKGIIVAIIFVIIPILFLGISGTIDDAFAQRQTPNRDTSVSASTPVRDSYNQKIRGDITNFISTPFKYSQIQLPHTSTSIPDRGPQNEFGLYTWEKYEKISSALTNKMQKEKIFSSAKPLQESELTHVIIKSSSPSKEYLEQLKDLGITPELIFEDFIQASVPLDKLQSISNLYSTTLVREPIYAVPDVVSEGVALTSADLIHAGGNTGQGVKIGILDSSGFDVTNPEISGRIAEAMSFRMDGDITGGGFSNHGGAVAEVVNDMAPGADLYLYNWNTEIEWLTLVQFLIDNRDLDIIVMSVSFFNAGPYDGTSFISQKINDAKASGILWVNSAGNRGLQHWQGTFSDPDVDSFHNFFGADETIQITANQGDLIALHLIWDDPFGGSANDYDLLVYDNGLNLVGASFNEQSGTQDPTESVVFLAPTAGTNTYHIVIQNFFALQPRFFELFSTTQDFDEYNVPGSSIPNAADANGAFTVGAHYWSDVVVEGFSSRGPTNDGRIKPDIAAPDGVANSVFGPFFGTSAAAPHVGGAAALTLYAFPGSTPDELQQYLEDNTFLNQPKDNVLGTGLLDVPFLIDSDGDGIPDIADICPGGDDNVDTDGDGIPDACDPDVVIPMGSSVPGCEETNECYLPFSLAVDLHSEVTWLNNDNAAHTVTSGNPAVANSVGLFFDSGLFLQGSTFSHTFDIVGTFPYFCVVHPWMQGQIIVNDPISGATPFADVVVSYDNLYGGAALPPPYPLYLDPTQALGPPNFVGLDNLLSVTLGSGGLVEVGFVDNLLTNSGDGSFDLLVYEIGRDVERTFVSIRPTAATAALLGPAYDTGVPGFPSTIGDGFYEVGFSNGSTGNMDIDSSFPAAGAGTYTFDAVQLIDDPLQTPTPNLATLGADIDAVGTLSSALP